MDINSLSDVEAYLNARTLMDMKSNPKKETQFPSDIDFEGRVLETSHSGFSSHFELCSDLQPIKLLL